MNKKIAVLGLGALIVIASCEFLKNDEKPQENEKELASNLATSQAVGHTSSHTQSPGFDPVKPPIRTSPPEEKPITQYDTARLDNEVREEALKMGKDPIIYRKIVRIEPDGTKIYRQIGMHVIVSPNEEEVFLPDEI